jgi:hypothetical protein
MRPYADITADLAFYRDAERKASTGQQYQIGQGGGQRSLQRGDFAQLTAKVNALQLEADAHPENPANSRTRGRRVSYLRPY